MAIKIIANGYYRSGTTLLGSILKDSLKGSLCFYEPLNPTLSLLVKNEAKTKKKHFLHNKLLFEDYYKLDEETLRKILISNPNLNQNGIGSVKELLEYFDLYENLGKEVILQTNRPHFFLKYIFDRYNNKTIHIVRHPLDILNSMEHTITKDEYTSKRVIRFLTKKLVYKKLFEVNKEFRWIVKHLGYPFEHFDKWEIKYFYTKRFFKKFVLVWVMSNYFALKDLEKINGKLVVYENLVREPNKVCKEMSEYLGKNIIYKEKIIENNHFKFRKGEMKTFLKVVKKLKIEDEFNFINEKVRESDLDYVECKFLK